MTDIQVLLIKLQEISPKSFFIFDEAGNAVFPEKAAAFSRQQEDAEAGCALTLGEELFNGFTHYKQKHRNEEYSVYIECSPEDAEAVHKLILLNIENILDRESTPIEYVKHILDGIYTEQDYSWLAAKIPFDFFEQRAIMISGAGSDTDIMDNIREMIEIIKNTVNTSVVFEYRSRIFAMIEDRDTEAICMDIRENILSELFLETTIAIGELVYSLSELRAAYRRCEEVLLLMRKYRLNSGVLSYEDTYAYQVADRLEPELKAEILRKVFTAKFRELMSNEMETTLEAFFKCNLNLTDTAAKLYIHRNTLLYRIDKIHKATGFDLRKFEDSWLFRLAWLISKETTL